MTMLVRHHKYICNPGWLPLFCKYGHRLLGDNLYTNPIGSTRAGKRVCKTCRQVHQKNYYDRPIVKVIKAKRRLGLEHNRAWRYWQMILDNYTNYCECCGETDLAFLTLDHKNGGGSAHRSKRPSMAAIYLDVIREGYPKDKYRILCMNCNFATRRGKICPHQRPVLEIVKVE